MPEEQPGNWWSWAPRFPKWAIVGAALIFNLVAAETIAINLITAETKPDGFLQITALIQTPGIIANFLALIIGIQLNFEVIYMILTKKANEAAIQDAKRAVEARVQSWYEAHKNQMGPDVPPPPINGNKPDHSR